MNGPCSRCDPGPRSRAEIQAFVPDVGVGVAGPEVYCRPVDLQSDGGKGQLAKARRRIASALEAWR